MSALSTLEATVVLVVLSTTAVGLQDQEPIQHGGKTLTEESAKHLCHIKLLSELIGSRAKYELERRESKFPTKLGELKEAYEKVEKGIKGMEDIFSKHCRHLSLRLDDGSTDVIHNHNCDNNAPEEETTEVKSEESKKWVNKGVINCEPGEFLRDILIRGAIEAYRVQMSEWEKKKPKPENATDNEAALSKPENRHRDQCKKKGFSVIGPCTVPQESWDSHLKEAMDVMEKLIGVGKDSICGMLNETGGKEEEKTDGK